MAASDGEVNTLVAPMLQPGEEVDEQPPLAVGAVVAQISPPPSQSWVQQEDGEQPIISSQPEEEEEEEEEKPNVADDAVIVPMQPEDEQQVTAAALSQLLESGSGPVEEGNKETLQDENPLQFPGPTEEEDKDTSQDQNLLQFPGPADEGDRVTLLQGQNHDNHDYGDQSPGRYRRDYRDHSPGIYRRDYGGHSPRRYSRDYDGDLFNGGGFWGEQRDHRYYDDSFHRGRPYHHRDHRDYVEELHRRRYLDEQGDPRYHDGPSHGLRYRHGHRDRRDYLDMLNGDRCRGEQRYHRDYDDTFHGGRDCRDRRDHREHDNPFHGARNHGDHEDHREYDRPFYGRKYSMNGFYHDNPLHYANDYLDRCGCMECRFGGRRIPSDYIKHNPMVNHNPMDSLDDERVYANTPCCFRNLICAKNDYPVGASLINPEKWTCFLNCILQCVVHTVPLVSKLLKDCHLGPCPSGSDEFCCYCSLRHHAAEAIRLSGNVLCPKKFVKLLKLISEDFRWGGHQDAHELLRCLLDKLDEYSVAPRLSSEEPSSIVKEVFGGQLKSQLHCPECNHCSDRLESFLDLSLEINQMDTVLDSLESFTKIEVVESFICDGCKSRVDMEKRLKVERAPEVLVIQLKRFENLGSSISKIREMVKYQLELDLSPFMSSADTDPQNYDLYGVVEHLGDSSKGHYVCYIRSSETDWYLFNDDKVMKLSEEGVLDSKAYLLFYVKRGSSPWFSTLLEEKNNFLLGYLEELAEKGLNEDGVPVDSDNGSNSGSGSGSGSGSDSDEQDSVDDLFGGPAARDEACPSPVGLSQKLQGNANGSTNTPDENEASCCSSLGGGASGETQKPTSPPPSSSAESGNVGGLALLLEDKETVRPPGGSSPQVDGSGSQGGSPQENEGSCCSLLRSSPHKQEEGCCPGNLTSQENKDDETMREGDEARGSHDSPAVEVRPHYGVETRARKRMRQQSAAATTAKPKEDGGLNSLRKKRRVGRAARRRSKKKQR